MNLQKYVAVAGAAVTSFLLVGVVVIEVVFAATQADVGPGIIGVFAGVVAGLIAATLVAWRWGAVPEGGQSALLGYAAFGLTIIFLASLSYVNVPGADTYLSVQRNAVIGAVVALVVAVGRHQLDRPAGATR